MSVQKMARLCQFFAETNESFFFVELSVFDNFQTNKSISVEFDDASDSKANKSQHFLKTKPVTMNKHNRLTSGELLSNDWRAVGFVSS